MNDELRQKLVKIRIIRNISVVFIFIVMTFITFKFFMQVVDDMNFYNRKLAKYARYIAFIPAIVLTYLAAFGFNRLINKDIMVQLFANIDTRLQPVSFSNFYQSRENMHDNVINGAAILPYHTDASKFTRTIVLDFDNSATIFMTDFKTADTENAVISKINFKGAVIAVISDNSMTGIDGNAAFIDKTFYEKCKDRAAYQIYSKPIIHNVNNSKILNFFHIYFSNAETAEKFNNSNILDAVLKIKESFGSANVSLSFQNNVFYILVENEDIKLKTNKDGFDIFTARLKAVINMYDVLKQ